MAALADACARAETVDGDRRWAEGITAAANWFLGDNDRGVVMWDPLTGGAFDGLEQTGANLNQGTESIRPSSYHAARTVSAERLATIGNKRASFNRGSTHIAADRSRVVTRLSSRDTKGSTNKSRDPPPSCDEPGLPDEEVQKQYDDVEARFDGRHHALTETFLRHADELSDRLDPDLQLSPSRRSSSARPSPVNSPLRAPRLCNPSMVLHPDQTGTDAGSVRFVMSVRAIGEGHCPSIGFRTGTLTASGGVNSGSSPGVRLHRTLEEEKVGGRGVQRRAPACPWWRR